MTTKEPIYHYDEQSRRNLADTDPRSRLQIRLHEERAARANREFLATQRERALKHARFLQVVAEQERLEQERLNRKTGGWWVGWTIHRRDGQ